MTGSRPLLPSRVRWASGLAVAAVLLFGGALTLRVQCIVGPCHYSPARRLLNLEAVGGLPRLFTTALFLAVAVCAGVAAARAAGPPRWWWACVSAGGLVLAGAKLLSAHSVAKHVSFDGTLVVSVLISVVALGALWWTARRWGVPAGTPVVLALAVYAAAALGLDLVTGAVASLQDHAGQLTAAAATFVEELGEALAGVLVLARVRAWMPGRR